MTTVVSGEVQTVYSNYTFYSFSPFIGDNYLAAFGPAPDVGTTVLSGGEQIVAWLGSDTVFFSDLLSQTFFVDPGSGTAISATLDGGKQLVYGLASATVVNSGGLETVSDGGLTISTTVNAGGEEYLPAAGLTGGTNTAYSTTINSGGLLYSLVHTYGTTISSGGIEYTAGTYFQFTAEVDATVSSGGLLEDSGMTISATLAGGREVVFSGGTASNTMINSGLLQVAGGGTASSTTEKAGEFDIYGSAIATEVFSGGLVAVFSGGTADSTIVNSGGMFNFGSALDTTLNSGGFEIDRAGAQASNTMVSAGGIEFVLSGGSANNTVVDSGGTLGLQGGAVASGWTISSGGTLAINSYNLSNYDVSGTNLEVRSGGIASGTIVDSGGIEYVQNSGTDISATINSGGSQFLQSAPLITFSGGSEILAPDVGPETASGTIINNGGKEYVSSGGTTISTVVNSGGNEYVYSGGVASGTTINGGMMELVSGGSAGSGPISFTGSSGTLKIDGTTMPTNVISGFVPSDTIDLANVSLDSTSGATIFETANASPANNVLQVTEGGKTYELQLDGSQPFSGAFKLSADQSGTGTNITVTSGAVTGYGTSSINSAGASPYSGVCQISWSLTISGQVFTESGTGFIVGPHTILTAAHVAEAAGMVGTNISVRPGTSNANNSVPVYSGTAEVAPLWSAPTSGMLPQPSVEQYDLAVIDCPTANFPSSSRFDLQSSYTSGTVNVTGYPVTVNGVPNSSGDSQSTQFNDIGAVIADQTFPNLFDYSVGLSDLVPGYSGGPLWVYNGGPTANAVGILVTDVNNEAAVRFTPETLSLIQQLEDAFTNIPAGQTLSGMTIAAGDTLEVLGTAIDAVVNSGGIENVYGADAGATINDGGYQYVLAGGAATNTLVLDPGIQVVSSVASRLAQRSAAASRTSTAWRATRSSIAEVLRTSFPEGSPARPQLAAGRWS
ncbi:autotransporter passenger strand-loop-strand repeat protein [Bradyrhizobium sp. USDA 4011]